MNYHKNIAKNIKKYCKARKINYSELARRAKLPLTTVQAFLYNKERSDPRLSTVHALAKALKVPMEKLIK